MQWLLALETDNDPIPACRLVNVFRRKGVKVLNFTLAAQPTGFSLLGIVESPETDVEHVFNFLRGVGGVRQVAYYRHEVSGEAAFVYIDAETDSSRVGRFLQASPAARLLLASHGKYLYELPAGDARRAAFLALAESGFMGFALAKASCGSPRPELVGATAER